MNRQTSTHRIGIALACFLLASAAPAFAQDGLTRAKDFYASASYEEALAVLTSLHGKTSSAETTDAARYEVLCLVALGRADDAKQAIETIVRAEPQYRLSETEASPRVRAMFDSLRLPMLPGIVKESYARGRAAFDRKDLPAALKEFDKVIALVGELEPTKDQSLLDVRALAAGFRDLGRAASAVTPPAPVAESVPAPKGAEPPVAPARPATPVSPPNAGPAANAPVSNTRPATNVPPANTRSAANVPPARPAAKGNKPAASETRHTFSAGDTTVKPPVPISQVFPPWRPETLIESKQDFQGALDLLIDEKGHVTSAAIVKSVQPRYDAQLLEAARQWTYRPATKDGQPVPYWNTVAVNLVHHGR